MMMKKWKNRRMIVNIGRRRTKINHTKLTWTACSITSNSDVLGIFVWWVDMYVCIEKKDYDDDEKEGE